MRFRNPNINNASIAEQFAYKIENERKQNMIRYYSPMILLLLFTLSFSLYDRHFFSARNIVNVLEQMAVPLILSTGVMFVLIMGSIDLSIEGMMGFCGAFTSLLVLNSKNANDFGIWGAVIPLLICVCVGMITGLLHVKLRIVSFVVTFAVGNIVNGVGILLYKGQPATIKADWCDWVARTSVLGLPFITVVAFVFFGVMCLILRNTAFGSAVFAIGDNEAAARASGIKVDKVKVIVFMITALSAGLAGILSVSRLKLGQVDIGYNQLFPVITALVVGGTSLSGGVGGAVQTMVGVLIYMELQNFLTILGVDPNYKKAIQGIIIIVAVAITIHRKRKSIAK